MKTLHTDQNGDFWNVVKISNYIKGNKTYFFGSDARGVAYPVVTVEKKQKKKKKSWRADGQPETTF